MGYIIFHIKIPTKAKLGVVVCAYNANVGCDKGGTGYTGRSPELTGQLL